MALYYHVLRSAALAGGSSWLRSGFPLCCSELGESLRAAGSRGEGRGESLGGGRRASPMVPTLPGLADEVREALRAQLLGQT